MKTLIVALSLAFLQPTSTATDATALVKGTNALVFMTINNPSMYDIYIVSGKCAACESVALKDGDKTVETLTVPAYGSLELAPSKKLVALSGLKNQFKEGDELKLTLETDGGASIEVTAIVKSPNH